MALNISQNPFEEYINNPSISSCDEKFDIVKYWGTNQYVGLQHFAKDILTIPASSSAVERLFSSCKLMDRDNRGRLTTITKSELQETRALLRLDERIKFINCLYCFKK